MGKMKLPSRSTLVSSLVLVGGISLVTAQERTFSPPKALGAGAPSQAVKLGIAPFNTSKLAVIAKTKKRFQPKLLTSNGNASGSPVDPNLKVDVGGGKQKSAGDLLNGTNELERNLNDLGYSLYDDENDVKTPIVKLQSKYANLEAQASDLRSLGGMKGATPIKTNRNISNELVQVDVKPPKVQPTMPGATPIPASSSSAATSVAKQSTTLNPAVGGTATLNPSSSPENSGGKKGGKKNKKNNNQAPTNAVGGSSQLVKKGNVTATVVMPPTIVKVDKTVTLFDKTYGDTDWFAIDFDSKLTKKADMKLRKVTANADIKAYLIGKSISLFHAKAEAGATKDFTQESMVPLTPTRPGSRPPLNRNRPRTGGSSSSSSSSSDQSIRILEASCLGDDLISPVNRTDSGQSKKTVASKSVNWEYSVKIPIIPTVNAVGTIGAKGSLGVDLITKADSEDAEISIVPWVKTSIYAEAGVEVSIIVASVEGGLGAELTLLNYDLDISAGVAISRTNINDKTYIAASTPIQVVHNFETLSGRLYGFARVKYWVPFKTHEKTLWEGNLIKWNGFTDSRTLYSENTDSVVIGESNIPYKEIKTGAGGN